MKPKNFLCSRCGESGHRVADCTRIRQVKLPIVQCYACGSGYLGEDMHKILREHGFDKRAALADVARSTCEVSGYVSFDGSYWDCMRRHLAWSDWPHGAAFVHFDGRGGVDPLDEEDRRYFTWKPSGTSGQSVRISASPPSQVTLAVPEERQLLLFGT